MTTVLTPDAAGVTAVPTPPAAAPGTGASKTGAPRRRRWVRVVAPVLVAFALIVATLVVHLIAQPSTTDPDYLNPASGAGIGALRVAQGATSRGITITVVHASDDAVALAQRGDATLFLPAPDLVRPGNQRALRTLPPSVTVVAVRPSPVALNYAGYGFLEVARRWATTAATGCDLPGLGPDTRALVDRDRYTPASDIPASEVPQATVDCFGHALRTWQTSGLPEFTLVSAADVFRNDRVGELDNAAVASAVLTRHPTLIWLDLHHSEPQPKSQGADTPPPESKNGDQGDQRTSQSIPLPSWVKAAGAGLALAAVLAAIAAGRRLGPPVDEPLPVRVRATETALGRGRLYRRAKARGSALFTLRLAASQRLRTVLGVPPDAGFPELVTTIAGRTGVPPSQVGALFAGPDPENDEQLVAAVAALDRLASHALAGPAAPTAASRPTGPDLAAPDTPSDLDAPPQTPPVPRQDPNPKEPS